MTWITLWGSSNQDRSRRETRNAQEWFEEKRREISISLIYRETGMHTRTCLHLRGFITAGGRGFKASKSIKEWDQRLED